MSYHHTYPTLRVRTARGGDDILLGEMTGIFENFLVVKNCQKKTVTSFGMFVNIIVAKLLSPRDSKLNLD